MTGLSNGTTDTGAGIARVSTIGGSGDGGGTAPAGVHGDGVVASGLDRRIVRLPRAQLPAQPASEAVALLGLIERAAADPAVDLDRMERMYAMYERATARTAKSAYLDALMSAKGKLPRIIKTGSASYKDKDTKEDKKAFSYAKWEEVCPQIEPVLAAHGLILTFSTEPTGAAVAVTGILSHRDGHSERAQMAISCDASGGKNNAQGWGSAVSYGKRYTAFALLNLVGHDDKDTDGNVPAETISQEQQDEIREALEAVGKELPAFCKYFKIDALPSLPAAQFERAITAIKGRK